MALEALRQQHAIDVCGWGDDEFGVFPQGARPKGACITPEQIHDGVLKPSWRYLFKKSRKCYPDQFWAEVVAYRIGCLLGVKVPPAFAAFDSGTGVCGALIEWFYDEGSAAFVWAGDYLQQQWPDFDRELGTTHTMQGNSTLLRSMAVTQLPEGRTFRQDWRRWWVEALIFDALIGNTDRHQDNWGFIFHSTEPIVTLAPLFDNGTSLGHERFTHKVQGWKAAEIEKYVDGGKHHVRWGFPAAPDARNPFELVRLALALWPKMLAQCREMLSFPPEAMAEYLVDLTGVDLPVPLSGPRLDFMLRLLTCRYHKLRSVVF